MELLIAIALMDLIALTLYSSMYIGFRANNNSRAILKPYQMVTPVFEFIREDLANALTPDGILAGVFTGEDVPSQNQQDADTLIFYSGGNHPVEGQTASNIIKVEYVLAVDTQRQQIVLKRLTTKNLLSPNTVVPDEEVVCRGLTGFDMKYYDGTAWQDSWDSTTAGNQLPWAVRVTLTIPVPEKTRLVRTQDDNPYRSFTRTFMLFSANQNTPSDSQAGAQSNG